MTESAIAATSTTLPVLPDDCIYEVFQHLSAKGTFYLANASKTCRAWNRLSEKNSLWQQLCLERWRTWPPPPPFSSYYDDYNQHQGIYRSLNGMSLLNNHNQDDYYINTRMGSSTTSSSSKYPSPLEKLPDMHQPSQWYSTSHPPYELDSWKEVFRERQEKDNIVRMLLDEMVEDSRNRMRHMDGIAGIGMAHARDVLENIIHGRNGEVKDLSRTYYAQKTLKRLQRGWVLDQWRGYRSGHQSFPVWQGCGLMAMFSDQTMELTDLDRQFQELADEFLAVSPIHGRGATSGGLSPAGSSAYGEDGLDGLDSRSATTAVPPVYVSSNYYHAGIDRYSPGSLMDTSSTSSGRWPMSPDRMQERIDETNERYQRHYDAQLDRLKDLIRFFTIEKGFKGNTENYYDPFNSFIDKVLTRKVGIPISLCIVFAELAERVGVHGVELMGFPQHFLLRHRPPVLGAGGHHGSPLLGGHDGAGPPAPPTHFLDLFHPPYRLLPMDEYENYFASLNIPRPMNIYRDLPTPPLEIFLRCLRNIILAVEQTGGAGRIGSDHQTSLYSGITQLLALHPIEEWGLYVLWLKYLGNFWPEDVGFVRMAIEDMELSDHRRMAGRKTSASPTQQQHQKPHHTYVRGRGGLQAAAGSASHYTSSTQETIKILRAHVRELEMADEAGENVSSSSMNSGVPSEEDENGVRPPMRVASMFGGEERRRPEPEYYVGEVFRHLIYRYTGVIYGYDLKCEAEEGWIRSMAIDLLPHGRHQPFYNALLSDGSKRYVAQENIQVLFREYRQGGGGGADAGSSSLADGSAADQIPLDLAAMLTAAGATVVSVPADGGNIDASATAAGSDLNVAVAEGSDSGSSDTPQAPATAEDTTGAVNSDAAVVDPDTSTASEPAPASTTPAPLPSAGTASGTATPAAPAVTPGGTPSVLSNMTFTVYNVEFSELGPLDIEAVGQYFEAWDNKHGHYVMNKELRKVYPTEDYL
ncbi:hypothetical protein KI688_000077 [Linnemannia hyalina]|uniref:F-box domain-containing protein n=1 Tax=Linnemannia hyalina TaxID=64524 RepID=A0A9P8BYC9_9FUNG|nr:hypothetical protein KI688_000077 [Linnemannia hyalina]